MLNDDLYENWEKVIVYSYETDEIQAVFERVSNAAESLTNPIEINEISLKVGRLVCAGLLRSTIEANEYNDEFSDFFYEKIALLIDEKPEILSAAGYVFIELLDFFDSSKPLPHPFNIFIEEITLMDIIYTIELSPIDSYPLDETCEEKLTAWMDLYCHNENPEIVKKANNILQNIRMCD